MDNIVLALSVFVAVFLLGFWTGLVTSGEKDD